MSRVYLRRGPREIVATDAEYNRDALGSLLALAVVVAAMAVWGWLLWGAL